MNGTGSIPFVSTIKKSCNCRIFLFVPFHSGKQKKYGYLMNLKIHMPEMFTESMGLWRTGKCAVMKS